MIAYRTPSLRPRPRALTMWLTNAMLLTFTNAERKCEKAT